MKNRSELISSKKNEIILDAYNANPHSMYLAIKNLLEIENYLIEHKIIILGDMLELGKEEIMEHEQILKLLHQSKMLKKNIFLIGNVFSKIGSEFQTFYNTNEIIPILKKNKLTGKIILIKGSRKHIPHYFRMKTLVRCSATICILLVCICIDEVISLIE